MTRKNNTKNIALPLGALAAGFGVATLALAQTATPPAEAWTGGSRRMKRGSS